MTRYLAPAAFLLATTAVVLAVRPALRSGSTAGAGAGAVTTQAHRPARRAGRPAPKRYYVIRSGDTLAAIAARFSTTVTALLRLNPGIRPTALVPGEQVRIQ